MGFVGGFLLVLIVAVNADEVSSAQAPLETTVPTELAPAVVVTAGADSVDANAIARVSATHRDRVEFGTGFQLDDGRIVTVAHALVDARSVRFGTDNASVEISDPNRHTDVAISRLNDLVAITGAPLSSGFPIASQPVQIGDSVALAGIPEDGRIHVRTGEVIARTDGTNYGLGRPDVFAISAPVDEGYSGGPVVNASGEVVAVIVGTETRSGVTLAVPIEHLP